MLAIIGIYFLLLSILLDDITTLILFGQGFSALETNPIYLMFGLKIYVITMFFAYITFIVLWLWSLNYYAKAYFEKRLGWKYYDIFIYFIVLLMVITCSTKIGYGLNNVKIISENIFNEDKQLYYQEQIEIGKTISADVKIKDYTNDVTNFSYFELLFYSILAYILFKGNYKVCPYEFA